MKISKSIKSQFDLRLRRIADVLHLNASFINTLGLINGKMGIAIFLYQYAHRTGNRMYENYAGELIDEIYSEINTKTPISFSSGLTGIGWGIEYLVRNGFVTSNTDESLIEIDNIIYKNMISQSIISENSNELFGYGIYYLSRLNVNGINDKKISTLEKKQNLIYLVDECEKLLVYKRYLDFNILSLSNETIISIAWFLSEMQRLGLYPKKVMKLLLHLPSDLELCSKILDGRRTNFVLWHILQNIIPFITDNSIRQKYQAITKYCSELSMTSNLDENILVENFISITCQKLIYSLDLIDDPHLIDFSYNIFNIIDNEENWALRLDNLNMNNIGLNGLTGIGLGLLNIK